MQPKERPTFNKIKKYLENRIESNMSKTHYIMLDNYDNGEWWIGRTKFNTMMISHLKFPNSLL